MEQRLTYNDLFKAFNAIDSKEFIIKSELLMLMYECTSDVELMNIYVVSTYHDKSLGIGMAFRELSE